VGRGKARPSYLLSVLLASFCAGFAILLPLTFNVSHLPSSYRPILFLAWWVSLALILVCYGLRKEISIVESGGNLLSLHKFHVVIFTVILPVTFLVLGLLSDIFLLPNDFEASALLTLWLEIAYLASLKLLVPIYGGIFHTGYNDSSTISPTVAQALASKAENQLRKGDVKDAALILRRAFNMTTKWLKAIGYKCDQIEHTLESLELAYVLGQNLPSDDLLTYASALGELPDWPSVVSKLKDAEAKKADWTSSLRLSRSMNSKGTRSRSLDLALAALIALGTLLGPIVSVYPDAFKNTVQSVSSTLLSLSLYLSLWLAFALCQSFWVRSWRTLFN